MILGNPRIPTATHEACDGVLNAPTIQGAFLFVKFWSDGACSIVTGNPANSTGGV